MMGARATFAIALRFPGNQTVLPDGRVVWSQNCTVNGTRVRQGDAVFPEQLDGGPNGVFPDGQPFPRSAWGKRSKFVYVWQTWGESRLPSRPRSRPAPPGLSPLPCPPAAAGTDEAQGALCKPGLQQKPPPHWQGSPTEPHGRC
nr:melanocyte protein PMEL [Pelodiscus sinensis]|eukprot:XP_006131299.1 melanocyte protein PMEL [Pelodiscus sinensis]